MNHKKSKLKIYKGIIQYLLKSAIDNLKNIAKVFDSSIEQIRLIHCQNMISTDFLFELQLVKRYQIILDKGFQS